MGVDTTTDPVAPEQTDVATDFSADTTVDTGVDAGVDTTTDPTQEEPAQETGSENVDEPILKTVQKLTGKLTQKMRDGDQELQSKDYKYVVNSILSAIDMTKITEEDMNDMLNKLQNKDSEDTTEAEPSSGEEMPPAEEPVQETQMPWESKRVTKSVIDEFIKNRK
jgi:hypothetical protein